MARSNSPAALEHWTDMAPQAPHRASIDGDAFWDLERPSPNLAAAMKVSPGGRLLLAFRLKDVRDYFVEGHLDQGAQVESDGAERATARRSRVQPNSAPSERTLEQVFDIYREAARAYDRALDGLREVFTVEALRLLSDGQVEQAKAVINSMPASPAKHLAISELSRHGGWERDSSPFWKTEPADYTPERAAALLAWGRPHRAEQAASEAMQAVLTPLLDDFLATGDRQGLADLIDLTPPSIERAYLMDALNYRMPPEDTGPRP
jgi:hypothetical protein